MKKFKLIILGLFFPAISLFACDICGCGVGSYYVGILPEFNKKLFGLRYRYSQLRTHIGAGGSTSYLTTEERFHTSELWGAWNLNNKFRIMATLPVNHNTKSNQGNVLSRTGLGDASVTGFYQLLKSSGSIGADHPKLVNQSLWIGAGAKLPTGNYDESAKNNGLPTTNTFQLGTGSTDFTANLMYDLRIQDHGLNVSASYKANMANREDYRYGNKFTLSSQLYHKFSLGMNARISPNIGIIHETAEQDLDHGFRMDVSGGNITLGTIGAEAMFGRFAFGAGFQTPFSQDLANGFAKTGNRSMVHFSILL